MNQAAPRNSLFNRETEEGQSAFGDNCDRHAKQGQRRHGDGDVGKNFFDDDAAIGCADLTCGQNEFSIGELQSGGSCQPAHRGDAQETKNEGDREQTSLNERCEQDCQDERWEREQDDKNK